MTPSLTFDVFERNWNAFQNQTVSTTMVSDVETPVSAQLKLNHGRPYGFLLESMDGGEVRGRYSIIGRDPDLIWRCDANGQTSIKRNALNDGSVFVETNDPPLDQLAALLAEIRIDDADQPQPMSAGLFGYLGYDMVRYMERLPNRQPDVLAVPEALLIRPTLLAIFDQVENKFTLVTPAWFDKSRRCRDVYDEALACLQRAYDDLQKPSVTAAPKGERPGPHTSPDANMNEAQYCAMVESAKEYIRGGDIFQVVLSQRFSVPYASSPFEIYRAVRRLDPSPFLFYFDLEDFSVVGSSPEILVRVRNDKITIRPIAGTRARGVGNQNDAELADELLHDPKELSEHLMLLDLGRNDVGRVATTGSVKVTARNTIEYYKHVMHIVSNVEGILDGKFSPLDALIGGFPAGTVSGAPKVRAMEIIAELEPDRRGVYGGCIGYFGSNGSMDTCIAIRTGLVKDGVLHVQAGAGIVFDSDARSEYRECAAKARGILRAAEETLRA